MVKVLSVIVTSVLVGVLVSIMSTTAAIACEGEEKPVPCRLDKDCYGKDKQLCDAVAKAFCAEPKKCTDPATLTMDPRNCVALIKRINSARSGKKEKVGAAHTGPKNYYRDGIAFSEVIEDVRRASGLL